MPEQHSLAIEPARAAWRDWLAAAQRVRQLTRDRAGACESLIDSLQRWPSFATADPWAINAEMPAGTEAAEDPNPVKRRRSSREALPPAVGARATPTRPAALATSSQRQPGMLAPRATTAHPLSPLATRARAAAGDAESLAISAEAQAPSAAVDSLPTAASIIATLVAETIGRHATGIPAGGSATSRSLLSDLLPDSGEPAPATRAMTTSPHAAPGESRPALQAVDLPLRAALERIARAEAPAPAAALFAPAGDLLQRLLPSDVAPTSTTAEPESTSVQRIAAPRAPSRLLSEPGHSISTPVTTRRLNGPLTDRFDENGEDSAAISRQLADQAWLRGVDFT